MKLETAGLLYIAALNHVIIQTATRINLQLDNGPSRSKRVLVTNRNNGINCSRKGNVWDRIAISSYLGFQHVYVTHEVMVQSQCIDLPANDT